MSTPSALLDDDVTLRFTCMGGGGPSNASAVPMPKSSSGSSQC